MLATLVSLLLAGMVPALGGGPSQPATGILRITVAVADAGQKPTPVPRHALLISDNPATAEPRQVITRLDGTVDVTLRAGSYIVESDRPVVFRGKAYRWTQTVDIAAGRDTALALTADNADAEAGAEAPAALDDDAAFLLPQLSASVVGLWTPTAHASGFVVDGNGLVVTNRQVVGTATMVEVQVSPTIKVAARVLIADAAKDVAVLWMDLSAAPSVRPGPLACGRPAAASLAAGQPLVAIGVSLRQQKEILSAKVVGLEPSGVATDLTPATGSLGGPVFTPRGEFVGLTSTVPEKDPNARADTRVVPAGDVCDVVAAAQPAMTRGPRPSAARLPVEREIPVPVDALQAAAARRAGSLNPYVVTGSAFEAALITPMATFGSEYQAEQLRERRRVAGKRLLETDPPPNQLLEFSNWSDYVWDFPPVLLIRVTPKLVENFWTTVGRAAAMSQGVALPPIKRVRSGFLRLQAFCGTAEVTPVHPFKLERRVSETEAVYEGLYAFDPEALGPRCGSVRLVMYGDKEPTKGDARVVDPAIVQQVWQDFAPYRAVGGASDAHARGVGSTSGELNVFTTRSIATVLATIGADFERRFRRRLRITSDVAIRLVRRIDAGEPFDVLVAAPSHIDELIKAGKILPDTRTDLARSGVGVAVRAGAPKPDVSSVDAFRRALISARSIAFLKEGQSGVYLSGLIERLGLADTIRSKLTRPETDIVAELVSRGEVELGIVVITQILTTEGVALAGPLPSDIQTHITFTAGISSSSTSIDAAEALLEALHSPAAVRTMKSQGMEPGPPAAPLEAGTSSAQQDRPRWLRTDSQRFEVHYPPALAGELERVTRSAERAYDRIGGQLRFSLATKVPLVLFDPSGPLPREAVVAYATSDLVAPQHPHRSRIVLPVRDGDTRLDATMLHELTHLLVGEIILPSAPGTGNVPSWVHEGLASYMTGDWSDDHERRMRALVAAGDIPALSQLAGDGDFADPRVNDALGHAAIDYIVSRWGEGRVRGFVDGLIIPRVDRTYDAVFELTPAEFDTAFRDYAARRFGPGGR